MEISPNGKYIVTAEERAFIIWDATTFQILLHEELDRKIFTLAWSPDSEKLAFGLDLEQNTAEVWSVSKSRRLHQITTENAVSHLAWSHNGQYLAVAGENRVTTIWEVGENSYSLSQELIHEKGVTWVSWRSDDTQLLTISDHQTYIWDLTSQQNDSPLIHLANQARNVTHALWSNDTNMILTVDNKAAGGQHHVTIWDLETAVSVGTFIHQDEISDVLWSNDNQTIVVATGGNDIYVWNINFQNEALLLRGHTDRVTEH